MTMHMPCKARQLKLFRLCQFRWPIWLVIAACCTCRIDEVFCIMQLSTPAAEVCYSKSMQKPVKDTMSFSQASRLGICTSQNDRLDMSAMWPKGMPVTSESETSKNHSHPFTKRLRVGIVDAMEARASTFSPASWQSRLCPRSHRLHSRSSCWDRTLPSKPRWARAGARLQPTRHSNPEA